MLGLVTNPAQAETIAGDIVEGNESCTWTFVSDLLATSAALALYSISSTPRRSAILVIVSAAVWSATYIAARLVLAGLDWLALTEPPGAAAGGPRSVALVLTLIFSGAVCGCVLERWNHGRGVNPCLPLAAALLVTGICLSLRDLATGSATWPCLLTCLLLVPACYVMPLLGGVLLGQRLRSQRSPASG